MLAERLQPHGAVHSKTTSDAARAGTFYHAFSPARGWRVLCLDAFQESVLGRPAGDPHLRRAERVLALHNRNDLRRGDTWFRGLHGHARRFVPYNGAFGREQLRWLRAELSRAARSGTRVVLLSHVVLSPEACDGTTMAWDYDLALEIVRESGAVVMVICGHDHAGGYHRDVDGTHHLTLRSPLTTGSAGHAFGILQVHADRVELIGQALEDLLPVQAVGLPQGEGGTLRFPLPTRLPPSEPPGAG